MTRAEPSAYEYDLGFLDDARNSLHEQKEWSWRSTILVSGLLSTIASDIWPLTHKALGGVVSWAIAIAFLLYILLGNERIAKYRRRMNALVEQNGSLLPESIRNEFPKEPIGEIDALLSLCQLTFVMGLCVLQLSGFQLTVHR